ncbi:hypothetical protein V8C86DRAFT_2574446 [Haematococcus lacustris]
MRPLYAHSVGVMPAMVRAATLPCCVQMLTVRARCTIAHVRLLCHAFTNEPGHCLPSCLPGACLAVALVYTMPRVLCCQGLLPEAASTQGYDGEACSCSNPMFEILPRLVHGCPCLVGRAATEVVFPALVLFAKWQCQAGVPG